MTILGLFVDAKRNCTCVRNQLGPFSQDRILSLDHPWSLRRYFLLGDFS